MTCPDHPDVHKTREAEIADQIDWMGGDLHKRLDGIGHSLNQTGDEFLLRMAKGEIRSWYEETLQTIARLDGLRRKALAEAKKKEGRSDGTKDHARRQTRRY